MPAVANTLFMAQSLVLIGSGLYMLLSPDEAVRSPQLAGTPPEVLLSFGLSTLSLGCCFAYLTYKGDRKWMRFSLLGRALGALVFARAGGALRTVAYWEGGMGVLAALVLWSGQ